MQTFLRDGRWLTADEVALFNKQSVIEPDDTNNIEIINTPVEQDKPSASKNNKKK